MDRNSILADLKKFAGKVSGAQKIVLEPAIVPKKAPAMTLDDVVALIKPPLAAVLVDGRPYSADNTTMNLQCEQNHMHSVFIKDIIDGKVKCATCHSGNKFTTLVRITAEELLNMPFTIDNAGEDSAVCKYINTDYKITLECCRSRLIGASGKIDAGQLIITLPYTVSARKIRGDLVHNLYKNKDHLPQKWAEMIETQNKYLLMKAKPAKAFQPDPVPYTDATADMAVNARKLSHPLLAKMHMDIVGNPNELCIENCKN